MKKFLTYLLSATFTLSGINVFSQKTWTLEDCIGYALQNNIQIQRQTLQTEIEKNNVLQSKIDIFPDLNASASHTFSKGFTTGISGVKTDTTNSYGSFGVNSTLIVFSGFQKINTIKLHSYDYQASMQNLKVAQNNIAINIASFYLQVLSSKELLEVAQNQLEVTNQQIELTKKLVDVGNIAKGSLLEIEAQAASEEATVADSKNKLDLAYLSLAQLLDLDTLKSFQIFIPADFGLPESFSDNPDSVYFVAVNNMPDIKAGEYSLKSAKSKVSIAQGARFPQLSIGAGYGSAYDLKLPNYSIRNQINDFASKQMTFSLSVPIFTKFQLMKNIDNAKIGVQDAEFALKQQKITLRKEIEQAYADALAAFQNYKARNKSAIAYEENFKYLQQKFDVGLANSLDYNVAKNNYAKAKSDLLQSKYDFIFKTKVLEFYKGNPLKL